jgi:uncharacterized protein DUF262
MFQVINFEARTLSWWYDQRENIDMDPPYQRQGYLWSERDRQLLIDTILNGYDIPKVYLADFTFGTTALNFRNLQYAVIDGKQRLLTIFNFFEGKLLLAKDFDWASDHSLSLGSLSYKDLLQNYPKVASKFSNFNLSAMRVITDDEAKINELFVRLNRGKPLTGAEFRNAMQGIVPALIRAIARHSFFTERISFTTKRMQAENGAAKLLIVEFRGSLVDTKKTHLDRFVNEAIKAEAQAIDFERARDRVKEILGRMEDIFSPRDILLSSQGPLTVYYWLVRETPTSQQHRIREFLVQFNDQRRKNRTVARTESGEVDSELVVYDNFDRSTNDEASLVGRFEILRKRFEAFTRLEP